MPKGHSKLPAKIIDPDTKVLTRQQQNFVNEYLACGSARKAAEKVGYADPRTAAQVLMNHPVIVMEIKEANTVIRHARRKGMVELVELANLKLDCILHSSRDEKKGWEDHLEAIKLIFEMAGLINKGAQKRAPYEEDYAARTEEELQFFVVNGYFPEDSTSLDGLRSGAHGRAGQGEGRTALPEGAAPDNGAD